MSNDVSHMRCQSRSVEIGRRKLSHVIGVNGYTAVSLFGPRGTLNGTAYTRRQRYTREV